MTPAQDPNREKNKKWQKANWQKIIIFEGFSKNGYHHVFQRVFLRRLHWTKLILMRFWKNR